MTYFPLIIVLIVGAIIVAVIIQILIIKYRGKPVPIPDIARGIHTTGQGTPLTYVIMGDSTAISQGSNYNDGFAVASTHYLAKKFKVTSINTGVSGATTGSVLKHQLAKAASLHPNIVLLAVGANDATHFIRGSTICNNMQHIIDELKKSNPKVAIIVTGSPAMDSVTRFPNGSKQIMGLRTQRVNSVFDQLIDKNKLLFAPIAEKTRDAFLADSTLTASDKFHPNKRGYALWIPVITTALDEAIRRI